MDPQPDRTSRDAAALATPVTVLTGFLGSGKTTVLNHVLGRADMADTAVIVNEFGEIGLDHLLVESSPGDMVVLQSGCVCCSIRGDLVDTLDRLRIQRERGDIPSFSRVAIETTGLADPAPVLQTLMREPTLLRHFRLNGLVTTVDAVNGSGQLDFHAEAVKQAALAGRLLLTKTDLATPTESAMLERRLRQLNPGAPVDRVIDGKIDPSRLFAEGGYDPTGGGVEAWIEAADDKSPADDHDHAGHRHDEEINTFSIVRDVPVPWPVLRGWLRSVISLRGADILRIKGVVNIEGVDPPVALHGVQHVFHPPRRLARWSGNDRRSRIVCITRGITQRELTAAFDTAADSYDAQARA